VCLEIMILLRDSSDCKLLYYFSLSFFILVRFNMKVDFELTFGRLVVSYANKNWGLRFLSSLMRLLVGNFLFVRGWLNEFVPLFAFVEPFFNLFELVKSQDILSVCCEKFFHLGI
jgi:hypothetical protein